jgi:hypothetical protein
MPNEYDGQGHPWLDFLHYRAIAVDWLYSGNSNERCRGNDAEISRVLSMTPEQVKLIRERRRDI